MAMHAQNQGEGINFFEVMMMTPPMKMKMRMKMMKTMLTLIVSQSFDQLVF